MTTIMSNVLNSAREGQAPLMIAQKLHVSKDLVESIIDHGVRTGQLEFLNIEGTCGTACVPNSSIACASCPLAK